METRFPELKKHFPEKNIFWRFWAYPSISVLLLVPYYLTGEQDFVIMSGFFSLMSILMFLPYRQFNVRGFAAIFWQSPSGNIEYKIVPNQPKYWSYQELQKNEIFHPERFYLVVSLGGWVKYNTLITPGLVKSIFCFITWHSYSEGFLRLNVSNLYRPYTDGAEIMTPQRLLREARSRYNTIKKVEEIKMLEESAEKELDKLARKLEINRASE